MEFLKGRRSERTDPTQGTLSRRQRCCVGSYMDMVEI